MLTLADELLESEQGRIDLLGKVGEIRGMLINLAFNAIGGYYAFDDILGQTTAKRILQNSLRTDTLGHAYLFSGPAGSGQMKTALMLAQAIFVRPSRMTPAANAWSVERSNMATIRI